MPSETAVHRTSAPGTPGTPLPADPCVLVIFGASGDLTRRLLMPALFNLRCDGLLPERFAVLGTALDDLSDEQFRDRMTADVRRFNTRPAFDAGVWAEFVSRLDYVPGNFGDPASYERLREA